MIALAFDSFLLFTPLLVLAIVALLGFVGCDILLGFSPVEAQIANLQAVPGNSQVALTWDPFKDHDGHAATEYHVVHTLPNSAAVVDINTGSTNTSFVDTGLTNGTTYTYHVYGIAPSGRSADSESIDVTPNTAINFVQMQPNSSNGNPPISVTLNNTTAGNLLIAAVSFGGNNASVAVSDVTNNKAFLQVDGVVTGLRSAQLFYLPSIPGGNVTITATNMSGAVGPCSICVSEYSGADLTSNAVYGFFPKFSPATGTPGVESISGLPVSLAQTGDVVYVVIFAFGTASFTPGTAFTQRPPLETYLLVEDSQTSIAATDVIATLNGGSNFVAWVALAVGIKA